MKNLIRIFLLLIIVGGAVSIHTSCSDENDCSLAGRPMMYCTIYTICLLYTSNKLKGLNMNIA